MCLKTRAKLALASDQTTQGSLVNLGKVAKKVKGVDSRGNQLNGKRNILNGYRNLLLHKKAF